MQGSARPWRLASGLVMLAYVTLHLVNHMLGIVSLPLAEAGLRLAMRLWRSVPGTIALYGAFVVHLALALRTVYTRTHWRLPPTEWIRLWAGFGLPLLLIGHAVATRLSTTLYDTMPSYERTIANLINGGSRGWQIALLAPGWVHGCLGLWIGLRHHRAMQRAKPLLIALLVGVPVLSAAGFLRMGREIEAMPRLTAPPPAQREVLRDWREGLLYGYVVLVSGAALGGVWRRRVGRQHG